jgi:hypothetical protein
VSIGLMWEKDAESMAASHVLARYDPYFFGRGEKSIEACTGTPSKKFVRI